MSRADPPDAIDEAAAGLAALADPTRRRLYRFVADASGAVGREQAAAGVEVAAHTAKFHLDRLVEEGLLEVEFRRLTGRTGPGAGRPAKLYRRTDRELTLSLPPRHYDLLGQILARSVEAAVRERADVGEIVSREARQSGHALGAASTSTERDPLTRLAAHLRPHGYEPRLQDGRMVLENCPFDRLAREHTTVVCGLNVDFVAGIAAGLACTGVRVGLDPAPGRCCVSATRDALGPQPVVGSALRKSETR